MKERRKWRRKKWIRRNRKKRRKWRIRKRSRGIGEGGGSEGSYST